MIVSESRDKGDEVGNLIVGQSMRVPQENDSHWISGLERDQLHPLLTFRTQLSQCICMRN